jgi:hypothetical protein
MNRRFPSATSLFIVFVLLVFLKAPAQAQTIKQVIESLTSPASGTETSTQSKQ